MVQQPSDERMWSYSCCTPKSFKIVEGTGYDLHRRLGYPVPFCTNLLIVCTIIFHLLCISKYLFSNKLMHLLLDVHILMPVLKCLCCQCSAMWVSAVGSRFIWGRRGEGVGRVGGSVHHHIGQVLHQSLLLSLTIYFLSELTKIVVKSASHVLSSSKSGFP